MDIDSILEKYHCIYKGHIIGTSGNHLSGYCNLDPLMPHADLIGKLTEQMVEPFKELDVETVVAPAVGAIPFSHWGAHHLSRMTNKEVLGVWADKVKPKGFAFERSGFLDAVKGKRILILEDFINQMFTAGKIIELVRESSGDIVGVASIAVNKGVSSASLGVNKLFYLTKIEYGAWTPEECLKTGLCFQKVPIVDDIGHGDEYKENHPDYSGGYVHVLQ